MEGDVEHSQTTCSKLCFNPRPRMEGDRQAYETDEQYEVSIHAPAWRATKIFFKQLCLLPFQSTPPHGGRLSGTTTSSAGVVFQSTPPHGGRPQNTLYRWKSTCFNPRPRMEGDTRNRSMDVLKARFNPRPRMEGDSYYVNLL